MKVCKILFFFLCLFSIFEASAKKTYDLKWKLAPNEEVIYDCNIRNIVDTTSAPLVLNDSSILSKELYTTLKEVAKLYAKNIDNATWKLSFVCDKPGIIDMQLRKYDNTEQGNGNFFKELKEAFLKNMPDSMSKEDVEFKKFLETGSCDTTHMDDEMKRDVKRFDEMYKLFEAQKDSQGKPQVALRGSVYENGEICSFWTKSDQLNLLAIMAQLPSQKVAVGDSWSIQTKLINCDQSVVCREAGKKNKVTLEKVEVVDGETIAVINYDIVESFAGEYDFSGIAFKNPFIGNDKFIGIEAKVSGKGYFSISKGRWNKYASYISITKKNSTNSNTSTQVITFEK